MKKILTALLTLLLFFVVSSNYSVHGEGLLELDASIGLEGKVKEGSPTVLKVTITNSGKAFSGDFVADIPFTYSAGSATVIPLEIAAGETKTFSIYLDGVSSELAYNSRMSNFSFYEGGVEKGKLVKHSGDESLVVQSVESTAQTMIVLTTREDEIKNIEDLRRPLNNELITYYASSKNDPYLDEDFRGFRGIDLIVVDDLAIQDLSDKQQTALLQWVQNGGKIIFTPTTAAKNGLGIFDPYKPLNVSDELQQVDPAALKNFTSANEVDPMIQVYNSTFTEQGKTGFQIDGRNFSGLTKVGSGSVIQLTFPLYDANLKALSGYGQILKNSFDLTTAMSLNVSKATYASNWSYINEVFETFSINVWLLILGICVYMIVIGPVLYKVLKKKDMREKLWWLIPVIAIATSLVIFLFGAKDRIFTPQLQQMALYTINDDDSMSGMYNISFLTNSSGDYTFNMDENTTAIASTSGMNFMDSNNLHLKSYVKETTDGKKIVLKDLNYWSVNSISGETMIPNVGNITSNLKFEKEQLTGTITSTLPVDLKDVKLLSGTGSIDLPDLPAGKTIEINTTVKVKSISTPYYQNYGYYYTNNGSMDDKVTAFMEAAISMNRESKPLLVGWTDVSIHSMKLKGGAKQESISYFSKAIDVENIIGGEITITNDDLVISPIASDANEWIEITDETQQFIYLDKTGQLNYEIKVSINPSDYKWKELDIDYDYYNYDLMLINQTNGENFLLSETSSTITENIEQYLTDYFSLQFRITRIGPDDTAILQTPKITLKGEPAK